MKSSLLKCVLTAALLAVLNHPFTTGYAQGSLTPPGPPAPSMKSLDQIEPRTIVNAANTPGDAGDVFIIRQPGSYYLTTNLIASGNQNGITIKTNNVTLDLNGFTVQSLSTNINISGIYLPPGNVANLTVRNGTIVSWGGNGTGDGSGVFAPSDVSQNLVFEHLNISGCGYGIQLSGPGVVRDCNVVGCIKNGISLNYEVPDQVIQKSIVSGCMANDNGWNGIYATGIISGCTANDNGVDGIEGDKATISGCTTSYNTGNGLRIFNRCSVSACVSDDNVSAGILVEEDSNQITGNQCSGNDAIDTAIAGIDVEGANNRIEDNHVTQSAGSGIYVNGDSVNGVFNLIIKNSVSGNGTNDYSIHGTQIVGPVITATGTITSTSPWANFAF